MKYRCSGQKESLLKADSRDSAIIRQSRSEVWEIDQISVSGLTLLSGRLWIVFADYSMLRAPLAVGSCEWLDRPD